MRVIEPAALAEESGMVWDVAEELILFDTVPGPLRAALKWLFLRLTDGDEVRDDLAAIDNDIGDALVNKLEMAGRPVGGRFDDRVLNEDSVHSISVHFAASAVCLILCIMLHKTS
jgi:hypothetical protein